MKWTKIMRRCAALERENAALRRERAASAGRMTKEHKFDLMLANSILRANHDLSERQSKAWEDWWAMRKGLEDVAEMLGWSKVETMPTDEPIP